jgi:hypothetical protein
MGTIGGAACCSRKHDANRQKKRAARLVGRETGSHCFAAAILGTDKPDSPHFVVKNITDVSVETAATL